MKGIEAVEGVSGEKEEGYWGEATGDGAIGPEVQVLRLKHRLRDILPRRGPPLLDHPDDGDGPPQTVDGRIEGAAVGYQELAAGLGEECRAIPNPREREFSDPQLGHMIGEAKRSDPSAQDHRPALIAGRVPLQVAELQLMINLPLQRFGDHEVHPPRPTIPPHHKKAQETAETGRDLLPVQGSFLPPSAPRGSCKAQVLEGELGLLEIRDHHDDALVRMEVFSGNA